MALVRIIQTMSDLRSAKPSAMPVSARPAAPTIADGRCRRRLADTTRPIWRNYDFRHGETDLYEGSAHGIGRVLSAFVLVYRGHHPNHRSSWRLFWAHNWTTLTKRRQSKVSATARPARPNTAYNNISAYPQRPTTSSPIPDAGIPTDTLTPSPCIHRVAAGDSLIAIISRCGHKSSRPFSPRSWQLTVSLTKREFRSAN